jgi:uncharacterized membrane protein YgcG
LISFVRAFLVLAAIAIAQPSPAAAQERITEFASDIAIARDGTLTVSETITVNAAGERIQHGIFRDFPTLYRDRAGNRVRVRFDVEEVNLDGHPEPYTLESIANGTRVRIGEANVILDPGQHTFLILYRTDRQIGFFPDYDELYWNVTGNGWEFAIGRAQATIHLPPGAGAVRYALYTGPQGTQGKDAQATVDGDTIRFVTTASLNPREGLTVAVGFSKGAVVPPSGADRAGNFLRDNASTGAAILGLIALGLYYTTAWYRFGRDPERGVIVPLFAPPKDFSAAAVRFVHRMGYDRKSFAAALIAMAVKGYLKITEAHGAYNLTRTGRCETETGLASTERAVARVLFNGVNEIELKNTNHTIVSRAVTALRDALKKEDEGVYFVTNRGWFFGGLAILVLSGAAAALLSEDAAPAGFILIWLAVWAAGTSHLLLNVYESWSSVIAGPGSRILNVFSAVFTTLFAAPFVGGLIFGIYFLGLSFPVATLIGLVAQGMLATLFYRLLKAPTMAGAKVCDQIEGFRIFLTVAEKDRLEVLNPPQVTPAIFEKFLPYAIALDAENSWSRKFEAETAAAGIGSNQSGYVPGWYSGPSFGRLGTAGFASSVGSAIAGATASAASAPGSSSGSGGGGSSGGGGGGGGGGGW